MALLKHRGVEFDFDAATRLTIPPLSLNAFRQAEAKIKAKDGKLDIEEIIDVVHSALQRNYPAMTREEVGELLDLENAKPAFEAAMRANAGGPASPENATGEAAAPSPGAGSSPT